jgi:hypothetical protein
MKIFNPTLIDAILSLVPNAQVTINGDEIIWYDPSVAPVTIEQIQAELVKLQANVPLIECKAKAQQLLQATDWTQLTDVSNINLTPHLTNLTEFNNYRSSLRTLVVNPVAEPIYPTLPKAIWNL